MEQPPRVRHAPDPGDAPSVRVVVRRDGPHVTVQVQGEADICTTERLLPSLVSALHGAPQSVGVDLSDLGFCDLAGSDALHAFADEATARAIPVDFRGMSPLLRLVYTRFPPAPTAGAQHDPRRRGTADA